MDPPAEEPAAKKPKKEARIFDGVYYTIIKSDNGKIEAKCNTCGEIKKGNESSTGNFKMHYKLMHETEHKELEKHLKDGIVPSGSNKVTQPAISSAFQNVSIDTVNN